MHTLTFEIPRWSQDGPRLPNSLKMAPKLTQNVSQNQCFWESSSMNYAMLNDISSIRKNKWSNTNQIMPTSTKKTHTTQRGVGGMRRRPGKFPGSQILKFPDFQTPPAPPPADKLSYSHICQKNMRVARRVDRQFWKKSRMFGQQILKKKIFDPKWVHMAR